jgi:hypothetical protein
MRIVRSAVRSTSTSKAVVLRQRMAAAYLQVHSPSKLDADTHTRSFVPHICFISHGIWKLSRMVSVEA